MNGKDVLTDDFEKGTPDMTLHHKAEIEELAEQRLTRFEKTLNRPLTFPLDTELFGEIIFDLSVRWEEIEELPCEQILAGLRARERRVVMNERRRWHMEENPGRQRLAQAYEMGKWDLFVNKPGRGHSDPFGLHSPSDFAYRSSAHGQVEVMEKLVFSDPACDLLGLMNSSKQLPDEEVRVTIYAAAILMPKSVVADEAGRIDCTHWPSLYQLAEQFGVTISALRVRLEQLNLLNANQRRKLSR